MGAAMTKADLPPAGVCLVELMQDINFGRIEGLIVRGGDPILDQSPHIIRVFKFGGDNEPRPEVAKVDFTLKAQVRELFAQMEAMGNGIIQCLEIKHGLPFKMTVEEDAA